MIEFRKITDFPRGMIYEILVDEVGTVMKKEGNNDE